MKPTFLRAVSAVTLLAVFALGCSGCQTAKGFGQDLEKLGQKIQKKS